MTPVSQPQVLLEASAPASRWWGRKLRLLLRLQFPAVNVRVETLLA